MTDLTEKKITGRELWWLIVGLVVWRVVLAGVALGAGWLGIADSGRFHAVDYIEQLGFRREELTSHPARNNHFFNNNFSQKNSQTEPIVEQTILPTNHNQSAKDLSPTDNLQPTNRNQPATDLSPADRASPSHLGRTILIQTVLKSANFDGTHYLEIITPGYQKVNFIQAFFPFYPLVIHELSAATGLAPLYAGLLVSNLALLGAIILLYALLKNNFSASVARETLLALLLWPASFYLGIIYSESLFLLLLVLALWLYQRQKWLPLVLTLIALTTTRIVGVVLVGALAVDLIWKAWLLPIWQKKHQSAKKLASEKNIDKSSKKSTILKTRLPKKQFWWQMGAVGAGALGLGAYMTYLAIHFRDPLYFMTVQSTFGGGRSTDVLVALPQVFWRSGKILLDFIVTGQGLSLTTWPYWQELGLSGLALIVLIYLSYQLVTLLLYPSCYRPLSPKLSPGSTQFSLFAILLIFSWGNYLIPTLTGNLSSMPRYLLVSVSIFLWFGLVPRHRWQKIIWLSLSSLLLIINFALFTQGYWVA